MPQKQGWSSYLTFREISHWTMGVNIVKYQHFCQCLSGHLIQIISNSNRCQLLFCLLALFSLWKKQQMRQCTLLELLGWVVPAAVTYTAQSATPFVLLQGHFKFLSFSSTKETWASNHRLRSSITPSCKPAVLGESNPPPLLLPTQVDCKAVFHIIIHLIKTVGKIPFKISSFWVHWTLWV